MLYEKTNYIKNNRGKWVKVQSEIIKNSMDYGRWLRAKEYDKQDNCSTYLVTVPTNSGMNRKVTRATSYFDNHNEKIVFDLITTSNRLPKKFKNKRK